MFRGVITMRLLISRYLSFAMGVLRRMVRACNDVSVARDFFCAFGMSASNCAREGFENLDCFLLDRIQINT